MRCIETARLILRAWQKADIGPYFQINQDPQVITFLRGSMTLAQVEAFIEGANHQQARYGYTSWATELKATQELIGFIGLNTVSWSAHFTPAVEIGWRLGSQHWGKGYATEGATAALHYGFAHAQLTEVVSFTVPANIRSIRVMEKVGLARDINGDFLHPTLPPTHPLAKHLLYRIRKRSPA